MRVGCFMLRVGCLMRMNKSSVLLIYIYTYTLYIHLYVCMYAGGVSDGNEHPPLQK